MQKPKPFKWTDENNEEQATWIHSYLTSKSALYPELAQVLKTPPSKQFIEQLKCTPNDPFYREISSDAKGAWQTRSYRRKNGKQVCFQMTEKTHAGLKALARREKLSQVNLLSLMIQNALKENQENSKEESAARKRLRNQLDDKNQIIQDYKNAMSDLLDALVEEIDSRCDLEAKLQLQKDPERNQNDERSNLVETRISEIEPIMSKLKRRRLIGTQQDPSLEWRMNNRLKQLQKAKNQTLINES